MGQVPALILDVDDDAALRILLAETRTAEIGGDDQAGTDDDEELPEPGDADTYTRPVEWGAVVTCDSEAQQVRLLDQLAGQSWSVRASM
ncbi:hypothetical protein [Nonomuraea sp. NPDC002799]